MKKLLLLCLVLLGGVMQVSAKTIYFANNWGKSGLRIHQWGGTGETAWPGNAFPTAESTKIDGYDVYALDLGECTKFMILYTNDSESDKDGNTEYISSLGITIRKCAEISTSTLNDGDYIDFSEWNSGSPKMTSALTVYTYNFTITTAENWTSFYAYLFDSTTNITGEAWPGKGIDGTSNVYTYTHKSFLPSIGILFNKGDGQPKTGDLTATPGTNNYYISTVSNDGGQGIKTNAYGYATAVSAGNLNMTSGIAYVAEDNGDGSATAHTIAGIYYDNPFIISGEPNTTYHFGWGDGAALPCTNAFRKGSNANITADETHHYYILKGDAFYRANDNYVADTKAYLELSQAATAKALIFMEDEETDGIKAVQNSVIKGNGEVYNFAGQRVAKDYKGIVIKNGKKYMNK